MAKLTKEQAAQLAELERLRDAPDEPDEPDEDQGDEDDGGHVIVLRGSRADAFLSSLLGPPAKKTSRAKPAAKGDSTEAPADTNGDDAEEQPPQDQPPPKSNRYFR